MVDKELDNKIKKLKEFMEIWVKFHEMYKNALSEAAISPEDEKNFLETKSLIARKYQALVNYLGIDVPYDDKTFDVITQLLSLKSVAAISDISLGKIEHDWNSSYILLNKLLGEFEARQEALKKISKIRFITKEILANPVANLLIAVIIIITLYLLISCGYKAMSIQGSDKGKIEHRQVSE